MTELTQQQMDDRVLLAAFRLGPSVATLDEVTESLSQHEDPNFAPDRVSAALARIHANGLIESRDGGIGPSDGKILDWSLTAQGQARVKELMG